MDAIGYTSNTGSTRRYAGLLAEKTGLSVYSLEEAKKALPGESEILYLGWLMAGSVKGYTAAAKRFRVRAVTRLSESEWERPEARWKRCERKMRYLKRRRCLFCRETSA